MKQSKTKVSHELGKTKTRLNRTAHNKVVSEHGYQNMIEESEINEGTIDKPSRRRGLSALTPEGKVISKALPEDVRAEIQRMSKSATESLFQHMDYDEAREVMRHGWPSRYFTHLSKIAKRAKL